MDDSNSSGSEILSGILFYRVPGLAAVQCLSDNSLPGVPVQKFPVIPSAPVIKTFSAVHNPLISAREIFLFARFYAFFSYGTGNLLKLVYPAGKFLAFCSRFCLR